MILRRIKWWKVSVMMKPHRQQCDLTMLAGDEAVLMSQRQAKTAQDCRSSILHLDEDYCVINKPYDVRMDGDFELTVEKLVPSWIASQQVTDSRNTEVSLKWVHQLDFATSGVLCIALNRHAAAAACSSFEHRQTRKEYLAVLQGHLHLHDWPLLQQALPQDVSHLPQYTNITAENNYSISLINRKKRKSESQQASTVQMPSSTASTNSSVWQDEVMHTNLQRCFDAFQLLQDPQHPKHAKLQVLIDQQDQQQEKNPLSTQRKTEYTKLLKVTVDELRRGPRLRKVLRKILQQCEMEVPILESAHTGVVAKEDEKTEIGVELPDNEEDVTTKQEKITALDEASLNKVLQDFRDPKLSHPFIYHLKTAEKDCLIVNIPVAELEDDFRMEPGHVGNPGKASYTEVHVLEHLLYRGQPVTKVLMKPCTGRRHQLRIHSLCMGHPIVGDFTYNKYHREMIEQVLGNDECPKTVAVTDEKCAELISAASTSGGNNLVAERMMLHAHHLTIPYPTVGKCKHVFKQSLLRKYRNLPTYSLENTEDDEQLLQQTPLIQVTAPDPFQAQNGILQVIL